MNKKNYLNIALLIIGLSILLLGTVLFFTVPAELKDRFLEKQNNKYEWENKEWGFGHGSGSFAEAYNHSWNKRHGGGNWFIPLAVLGVFLIIVIGKRLGRHHFGHGGHGRVNNPMDILRKSYANGRISREEYLEKKTVLEEIKEEK
jgi:uncharacterized membrane protein